MTMRAMATYMGHKLGGNIRCSIEMFMLTMLTELTRPLPPPPCRIFGAHRLEFSSSIRQLAGLGGLFCQLNVTEQGSLITMI